MTEFEWETTASRQEVAALLRRVAEGLDGDGGVELEGDDWELKIKVGDRVELEVELEIEGDESELEIELKWSTSGGGEQGPEDAGQAAEGGQHAPEGHG